MATPITSSLKTAVLRPGECVILPVGAVVQSVVLDGAASVTSSCGDLPPVSSYKCGAFYLFLDIDANDENPLDEENTFYVSLRVGGTTYIMNQYVVTGDNPGTLVSAATLNLNITDTALFQFMQVTRSVLAERQRIAVYFKVPEALFNDTEMKISDRGTFYYLKPEETTCDSYPNPA